MKTVLRRTDINLIIHRVLKFLRFSDLIVLCFIPLTEIVFSSLNMYFRIVGYI